MANLLSRVLKHRNTSLWVLIVGAGISSAQWGSEMKKGLEPQRRVDTHNAELAKGFEGVAAEQIEKTHVQAKGFFETQGGTILFPKNEKNEVGIGETAKLEAIKAKLGIIPQELIRVSPLRLSLPVECSVMTLPTPQQMSVVMAKKDAQWQMISEAEKAKMAEVTGDTGLYKMLGSLAAWMIAPFVLCELAGAALRRRDRNLAHKKACEAHSHPMN